MSWVQQYERYEGSFQQVASIDIKVKDALEQGLLDQITDHTENCSDDNPQPRDKLTVWGPGTGPRDLARCPRCTLLHASLPTATGYLLDSPLKLRVIVQIQHRSPFDYIRWD